jgi:ABC-type phosphate transport system auxiliary subunit
MVSSTKQDDVDPSFNAVQRLARECDELRAVNKVLQLRGDTYLEQLEQKHAEIERLQEANAMLGEERDAWRQAFHRAHEVRGESLKACPLCTWQT